MFRRLLPAVTENKGWSFTKVLPNFSRHAKASESSVSCQRCFSSDAPKEPPAPGQVFRHERHNMYVCWHPEVPFPYEMTKPVDLSAPVAMSNLKIHALTPVKEAFRRKSEKLMIQELIKLTYSTKHRFYGRFGKSKRMVLREMDPLKQKKNREYL